MDAQFQCCREKPAPRLLFICHTRRKTASVNNPAALKESTTAVVQVTPLATEHCVCLFIIPSLAPTRHPPLNIAAGYQKFPNRGAFRQGLRHARAFAGGPFRRAVARRNFRGRLGVWHDRVLVADWEGRVHTRGRRRDWG